MLLLGSQGPGSAGRTAGALSHDTSLLVSKLCTYTRSAGLFCHRRLTVSPCASKAFILTPPQSPILPFISVLFELESFLWKRRESMLFVWGIWLWRSLWEAYILYSKISPVCRVFSQPVFIPLFVFYVYTHSSPAHKGYNLVFIKAIHYSETENNILVLELWVLKECAGRTDAAFGKDGVKTPSWKRNAPTGISRCAEEPETRWGSVLLTDPQGKANQEQKRERTDGSIFVAKSSHSSAKTMKRPALLLGGDSIMWMPLYEGSDSKVIR